MLENERLIYKMLLEQKIRLVTSTTFYESSPVGAYEFPVMRFGEKPMHGREGVSLTQFPSDRTLAASWNTALTERVFACAGEEARSFSVYDGYISYNDPLKQNVSSSHFQNAQYFAAKHRGAAGKQPTAHQCSPATLTEGMLRKNSSDTLLEDGAPDVLIAECVEDAIYYLKNQNFNGLVYGVASNPEEAARYFFEGCSFVYLRVDFLQELIAFIDARTKNYRVAYGEYKDSRLGMKELDRRARALEIFDENLIDTACDRMISFFKKQKKAEIKDSQPLPVEKHASLARQAARESIVLLKNTNHILPLKRGAKIALVGEYAENFDFQRETFACSPTRERLPIDVATEFDDLNIIGYAAGYRKDKEIEEALISNAARLASGADCAIVFLAANPDEAMLPENQMMLLKSLLGWKINVIAVIAADHCIDLSFAKGCQAILYTGRGGQETAGAVFDVLTGAHSPSGKLTEKADGFGSYPFGYGLTYTSFSYSDLVIDESGVSVIVENKGDYDAYAVVQLYLQKDGSMYENKTLKGFAKEFVKKGDAVRIKIPFSENTFRYYDAKKMKYRTQGGVYKLFISDSLTSDKLTGTVKLASDDGNMFTNTIMETVSDGQKAAFSESWGLKEKRGMSLGLKLFLLISAMLYFNAVMAMLLFAPFVPVDRTNSFYLLIGAITGVIDLLLLVAIILVSVKRKKRYIPVNDVLSDMVDQVDDFIEVAKLTYPDPVKERKKADRAKKEEEERLQKEAQRAQAKQEEEQKEKAKAEVKPEEKKKEEVKKPKRSASIDKPSDYPEANSFEAVYLSFRNCLLERGINIGASSARRLIAAIASSRLVLVTSRNGELLPEFLQALNGYFGGTGVTQAEDQWNTMEDLLWSDEGGRRSFSPFTNALNDAYRKHNKNAVALISNVDSANLSDWFADMIEFAASPSEEHYISLNGDTKVVVPQNLCCMLFSKESGFETELPREVFNASIQIEVSIRRTDSVVGETKAEGSISYPNFQNLVREAREKYFISERSWAKIDALYELLSVHGRLLFGNKNTIMAEKFTSVLMACGAEETEALTSLLRFKIVPILKTTREYQQEDGINVIFDFLQKAFPDDDLTKVQKLLSERPKKAEEKVRDTFYTPDRKTAATETVGFETEDSKAEPQETEYTGEEEPVFTETAEDNGETPAYDMPSGEGEASADASWSAGETPAYDVPLQDETWYQGETPAGDASSYGYAAPGYDETSYGQPSYGNTGSMYGNSGTDDYGYGGGYQNYSDGYQGGGYANPYGQDSYGQDPYGQDPYNQSPYGSYGDYQNGYGYQDDNGYSEYGNYSTGSWDDSDNGSGGEDK